MVPADPDTPRPTTPRTRDRPADRAGAVLPASRRGGLRAVGPATAPNGRRRGTGDGLRSRSISVALVVGPGRVGLFMSGYTLGRQAAAAPGHAGRRTKRRFQPFWDTYHTITEHYAGGAVDRETLVQGAIKGMIDSLGDPFSPTCSPDEYPRACRASAASSRGSGPTIATAGADGTEGCTPLGPTCHLVVTSRSTDRRPRRPASWPATSSLPSTARPLDGLTVDAARDRIRGPKGTVVTLTIQRGSRRTASRSRSPATSSSAGGRQQGPRRRDVGYVSVSGFSDNAADDVVTALQRPRRGGPDASSSSTCAATRAAT